jgi:hypothetical protein
MVYYLLPPFSQHVLQWEKVKVVAMHHSHTFLTCKILEHCKILISNNHEPRPILVYGEAHK